MSKYVTWFRRIYKRIDPHKSILNRTIVKKFINSLPTKFVKILIIIDLANLDKAIKAALDLEAS